MISCFPDNRFLEKNMSQPGGSQQRSQPEEKIWALKGAVMSVLGFGKKKSKDQYMTLRLQFLFENDPSPMKVGR